LNKPNFTEIGCITGTTMVAALDATTLWRWHIPLTFRHPHRWYIKVYIHSFAFMPALAASAFQWPICFGVRLHLHSQAAELGEWARLATLGPCTTDTLKSTAFGNSLYFSVLVPSPWSKLHDSLQLRVRPPCLGLHTASACPNPRVSMWIDLPRKGCGNSLSPRCTGSFVTHTAPVASVMFLLQFSRE
jgi:hypothetical protein